MEDDRIEAFVKQVLDLEGGPRVGEGVRVALADYEKNFPEIKPARYRDRIAEEVVRLAGTRRERHLRTVLAVINSGSRFPLKDE